MNQRARDLVSRTVPVSIRRAIRRRLRRTRSDHPGLPPELSSSELNAICAGSVDWSPDGVTHLQISGWRKSSTGAFRVRVNSAEGNAWTFFYKNSVLDTDETPGLAGLPEVPRSEFLVYATATPSLKRFLPETFFLEETRPGLHYRLALEDLKAAGYKTTVTDREVLAGVTALPAVHAALREWAEPSDHPLFRYDRQFSVRLRDLARRALERWTSEKPTRPVERLLSAWPALIRVHDLEPAFDPGLRNPVHGDANRANVLVPATATEGDVKLVDWEWAGWRLPHIDLAALVKGRSASLIERAIDVFSQSNRALSKRDHRHLLLWSLLELRLLDASYVVSQHFGAPGASRMDLDRYLHVSVEEILRTIETLRKDQ